MRSPRNTSPPDDAAGDRAPLRVRVRHLHQRVVPRAARAAQDHDRPERPLVRAGGGAAHPRVPLPGLERQRHPSLHHFTITRFHDRIEVSSRSLVSTHPAAPPLASCTDPAPVGDVPYPLLDFLAFGGPVQLTPALRAAHKAAAPPRGTPLSEHVQWLGRHLAKRFEYQKDVTKYDSTTEDFLTIGAGVCQDFAHLMLGLLRLSGVPCRYVSGYLHVERKRRDPSQSHAWIEFWAPSHGWIPFYPTHDRVVDERYVVVGHGRTYDDVPPNKGIFRGVAQETLRAEVYTQPSTARALPQLTSETR